ncbi:MAG TPA: serine hydrolase domain-containing protein, partial [Thermoanaerobaculia bacterium]|nr:serine hydrolase domain-containing protein [Thermoanaerobaculia bacterium]
PPIAADRRPGAAAATLLFVLNEFLQREIDLGSFPGAAYAVGTADGITRENALGHAVAVPLRIPATLDTIWDCASTTKVLVTTILVLQAVAEGKIALDDVYRCASYRELLSHTSGLRSWLPTYWYEDPLSAIERWGRVRPRGSDPEYSDLNFFLLYYALEEIYGDYREAARARIFEPLGLRDTCFDPPAEKKSRIAATEWGQRFERVLAARLQSPPATVQREVRQGLMWGDANDGNSFHAGGTLGNAGLFATARDAFRIMQAFVRGELVPRALAEESARKVAGDRALGWQLEGPGLPRRSFGHMGFTGTSVWCDGTMIYVLMTNRVHPCAAPIGMHRIRGEFHRLASSMTTS